MISMDGYNNVDQMGDGYMEQEEEWEREGLLDPAWEKQQKKVSVMDFLRSSRLLDTSDRGIRAGHARYSACFSSSPTRFV